MIVIAHIAGIPVEESVLQFAPAGAAMATGVWIAVRASLRQLRHTRVSRTRAREQPRARRSGR
jgi:hypothetical protein